MIAAIESAIVARIQFASDAGTLGYRFRKVASYGGEFDEEGLKQLVKDYPAAWTVFGGEPRPEHLGQETYRHRPGFAVIVAARSLRNEEATRRGAAGDVGTYQLVKDVRALLIGQTLALDIHPLSPGAVRSLFNGSLRDRKLSLYGVEFHTAYDSAMAAADAAIDDFTAFHADWDIPAGETVAPPLPAADADARDDVTLPGPGA